MLTRRGLAALPLLAPAIARAQVWPAKPIRLIVPFVAGSSTDTIARVAAARIGDALGERFVLDNRAGAGGLIASQMVARAAPDGYTLLFGGSTVLANAALYRDPGYNPGTDFAPVVSIVENPALLAVKSSSPWRSVAALAEAARQATRPLSYGSGGVGTPAHLAGAALLKLAGAEGVHVPYRGANQAVLALEQGEIDFTFAIIGIALPLVRAGNFRPLMVTGEARAASLPEVPTFAESLPGGPVVTTWVGLIGPAALPEPIQDRLNAAAQKAARDPAFVEAMTRDGGEMRLSANPEAFRRFWALELGRQAALVALTGARAE